MSSLLVSVLALLCLCISLPLSTATLADFDSLRSHSRPSFIAAAQPPSSISRHHRHPSLSPPRHSSLLHVPTPSVVRQREERQLARAGMSVSVSAPAPAQWFSQRLDHFDRSNGSTWQQRYFVNDSLWNGTGPVFFLFGHEREMSADLVAGTWVINWLAEHFGALIVCLEHRFYGQSWPTDDRSIAFLQRYLSTEQALEDAAVWTAHIKQQYGVPESSRWVVMGRSYGGTLAALFRLKFPHLVTGAFATSGPLQAKVDYPEYNEVVGIALGEKCSAALKRANDRVTALLSNATGQKQLAADFGFCAPLTSHEQHAMLIQSWSGDIDGTVQYSVGNDTQRWCDSFLSAGSGDPYKALIELYYPPSTDCTPPFNYSQYIDEAKRDTFDLSWVWQTCSAYGWYQTGNSSHQPFSPLLDASFSLSFCRDVFGQTASDVYAAIAETNDRNGGFNISNSRVLYTNGELDPWHVMAVHPPNRGGHDNVVYMIEDGASHCTDFMPPADTDSPSLKKLRGIQIETLAAWLAH